MEIYYTSDGSISSIIPDGHKRIMRHGDNPPSMLLLSEDSIESEVLLAWWNSDDRKPRFSIQNKKLMDGDTEFALLSGQPDFTGFWHELTKLSQWQRIRGISATGFAGLITMVKLNDIAQVPTYWNEVVQTSSDAGQGLSESEIGQIQALANQFNIPFKLNSQGLIDG